MTEKDYEEIKPQETEQTAPAGPVSDPAMPDGYPEEQDTAEEKPSAPDRSELPRRAFRALAALYIGYIIFSLIKSLRAGEVAEKHRFWIMLAACAFAAGIVWLIWPELKRLFRKKKES